jgi:hypothetical protein
MQLSERDVLIARAQMEDLQRNARLLRLIREAQAANQPAPAQPASLLARLWSALFARRYGRPIIRQNSVSQ